MSSQLPSKRDQHNIYATTTILANLLTTLANLSIRLELCNSKEPSSHLSYLAKITGPPLSYEKLIENDHFLGIGTNIHVPTQPTSISYTSKSIPTSIYSLVITPPHPPSAKSLHQKSSCGVPQHPQSTNKALLYQQHSKPNPPCSEIHRHSSPIKRPGTYKPSTESSDDSIGFTLRDTQFG
jgi:hypothetical protein